MPVGSLGKRRGRMPKEFADLQDGSALCNQHACKAVTEVMGSVASKAKLLGGRCKSTIESLRQNGLTIAVDDEKIDFLALDVLANLPAQDRLQRQGGPALLSL